jgi:hypothetical protein
MLHQGRKISLFLWHFEPNCCLLNSDKAKKFSEFYSYLSKFYFSENSPFNPGNYDFYNSIIFQGNMTKSTNCLESLNKVLKDLSGTGFLHFAKF